MSTTTSSSATIETKVNNSDIDNTYHGARFSTREEVAAKRAIEKAKKQEILINCRNQVVDKLVRMFENLRLQDKKESDVYTLDIRTISIVMDKKYHSITAPKKEYKGDSLYGSEYHNTGLYTAFNTPGKHFRLDPEIPNGYECLEKLADKAGYQIKEDNSGIHFKEKSLSTSSSASSSISSSSSAST